MIKNKGSKCTLEPIFPSIYGHVLNMIKRQKQEMERTYLEKMVIIPVNMNFIAMVTIMPRDNKQKVPACCREYILLPLFHQAS